MRGLVTACRREIPRAFEAEPYEQRRDALRRGFAEQHQELVRGLEERARSRDFAVEFSQAEVTPVPLLEGRRLSREEFQQLPGDQRAAIEARGTELQQDSNHFVGQVRRLEKQAREQMQALDQEIARGVVAPLVGDVREQFADLGQVQAYLNQVEEDLVARLDLFRPGEQRAPAPGPPAPVAEEDAFARYEVNVVVDNTTQRGAPVVVEDHPTYYHLTGRIEYAARASGMVTDHRFIKAGAVQRASGGYLVIQARDVLGLPVAWSALKRALRSQRLAPENLGEQDSPLPKATLRPEPIPVHLKVVLIGDRPTYQRLYSQDVDFQKLFRARADFDVVMPRGPESERAYAVFLAKHAHEEQLLPFDRSAVARVVDHGARLARHQRKLSTRFSEIATLAAEASYWASQAGRTVVTAADVVQAAEHHIFRSNLVEERLRQLVAEGTLVIETAGAVVGQVNGLSVMDLGDYAFGYPSRITARVAPGTAGVVDIERETRQSGPAHSKGVLTLAGYLLGQYAAEGPLALSASIGFEQMYEAVDGDSASSAELYALLSALGDVPLRQDLAVTGSVNQRGQIQAIGGVNEKIEGFFAVCRQRGLSGTQGVILPRANIQHLMLRGEVIEAVRGGAFHLYAVESVDEGLELLTGLPAGERRSGGSYAAGTLHERAAARLRSFITRLAELRALGPLDGRAPGPNG
jgi:lon-related putative ATP-dependent protease